MLNLFPFHKPLNTSVKMFCLIQGVFAHGETWLSGGRCPIATGGCGRQAARSACSLERGGGQVLAKNSKAPEAIGQALHCRPCRLRKALRLLELTANPRRYFAAGRVVGCDGSGDFKTASSGDHAAGGNEGVSELVSGLWPHTRRKIADTRRGFRLGGWRNC